MNDQRWQDIIGMVKDKFEVKDYRLEDLSEEEGPGTVEVIEFISPLGLVKLERTTKPLVIDKKTIGSRRIGSSTTVNYIYSDTEKTHKFKAYQFNVATGDWKEMAINPEAFAL